jgi:hypothetical protein
VAADLPEIKHEINTNGLKDVKKPIDLYKTMSKGFVQEVLMKTMVTKETDAAKLRTALERVKTNVPATDGVNELRTKLFDLSQKDFVKAMTESHSFKTRMWMDVYVQADALTAAERRQVLKAENPGLSDLKTVDLKFKHYLKTMDVDDIFKSNLYNNLALMYCLCSLYLLLN